MHMDTQAIGKAINSIVLFLFIYISATEQAVVTMRVGENYSS